MNRHITTVIVAPMTIKGRPYPTRVSCVFEGKEGQVVLDQIRTVDKSRLIKKLGDLAKPDQNVVLTVLVEMFAAYSVEIGHVFGMKPAGCSVKSATPV